MPHLKIVPNDEASARARFHAFQGIPRPDPLAHVGLGGEPATAQLDRTVERLRARDELLLTDTVHDQPDDTRFFRGLAVALGAGLLCWIALGIVFAWLAGRL